ncbi:MAG: DUF4148 domain-containing protein [Paraburkholderia sp.]|uniref:DUF4148 domain-containing protein n=1 Tax=Paraburkholderia sp. TaxID=1926495 RepID=UPI003C315A31
MKLNLHVVASAILMSLSTAVLAAPSLTPQQCDDYPFVHPAGDVTHGQVMQELKELEAVGYRTTPDDPYYPRRIEKAEKKLQVEYRQDCMPVQHNNMNG